MPRKEMTPTPVVKIATDNHTARFIGLVEFEEFDLFMRRMDPLYSVTCDYCDRLGVNAEQRAKILLNVMSDKARKMAHAFSEQMENAAFPAMSFELPAGTQLPASLDQRLQLIQMVEQIEHHVRNGQSQSALLVANNLRNKLTK